MCKVDWKAPLPYNHVGRWNKCVVSIFNPIEKITWPQYLAELIIQNRAKVIKTFQKIKIGPGWSNSVRSQYRSLIQQAYCICNYFPHPDDDPLIYIAFQNYIKNNRVLKIGQYRKVRVSKSGKINITDAEQDIVLGITCELERLKESVPITTSTASKSTVVTKDNVEFKTHTVQKSGRFGALLDIEQELNNKQ